MQSFQQLGRTFTSPSYDISDITAKQFIHRPYKRCALFFREAITSNVKYKLFYSYCISNYGGELWSLTTSNISNFCTAWCHDVRVIWNSQYTHTLLFSASTSSIPVYLFLTNFVTGKSNLLAHAFRIVYTLLAVTY